MVFLTHYQAVNIALNADGLENSMNCIVHRVTESDITDQLSFVTEI